VQYHGVVNLIAQWFYEPKSKNFPVNFKLWLQFSRIHTLQMHHIFLQAEIFGITGSLGVNILIPVFWQIIPRGVHRHYPRVKHLFSVHSSMSLVNNVLCSRQINTVPIETSYSLSIKTTTFAQTYMVLARTPITRRSDSLEIQLYIG
jgi:hypothetical protein